MKSKAGFVSWLRCRINILLPLFGSWIKKSVIQQWTSIKQKSFSWLWSLKLISQMCFDSFFVFLRGNMWRVSDIYKNSLASRCRSAENMPSLVWIFKLQEASCSVLHVFYFTFFVSCWNQLMGNWWFGWVLWDSIRGTRPSDNPFHFRGSFRNPNHKWPQTNKLTNSWERQVNASTCNCGWRFWVVPVPVWVACMFGSNISPKTKEEDCYLSSFHFRHGLFATVNL